MTGRGAWSVSGQGGTLSVDGKKPGPYYVYGVAADKSSPDVNVRAIYYAVRAIQNGVNYRQDPNIVVDGIYGLQTKQAVAKFQQKLMQGQSDWGGVGPETSQALFTPQIKTHCKNSGWGDWTIVCGILKQESTFDPGAVGYIDDSDLGLAQINGPAHPGMSESERFNPPSAIQFVVDYLVNASSQLSDQDAVIASYNLGIGGARSWLNAGKPDIWTPLGSNTSRDVRAYIDKIKTGC